MSGLLLYAPRTCINCRLAVDKTQTKFGLFLHLSLVGLIANGLQRHTNQSNENNGNSWLYVCIHIVRIPADQKHSKMERYIANIFGKKIYI